MKFTGGLFFVAFLLLAAPYVVSAKGMRDNSNSNNNNDLAALSVKVAALEVENLLQAATIARLSQTVSQLSSSVSILNLKAGAMENQFAYNRDIDRSFTLGATALGTAAFNATITKIGLHFCPDSAAWHAYVNDADVFDGTGVANIDALYNYFSGSQWRNFSRHIISNPIPTVYTVNNTNYVELNASIAQLQIKRGATPALDMWAISVGWYQNTWRQNVASNGAITYCMTDFKAATMSDHSFPYAYGQNFVFDPSAL